MFRAFLFSKSENLPKTIIISKFVTILKNENTVLTVFYVSSIYLFWGSSVEFAGLFGIGVVGILVWLGLRGGASLCQGWIFVLMLDLLLRGGLRRGSA